MNLSRETLFNLSKTLVELDVKKYDKYFLLAVTHAKAVLEPIVEEIKKKTSELYSEEYAKYNNLRLSILAKYAKKDENGNPIITNDQVNIPQEAIQDASKEVETLMVTHKDVIEKFETVKREFEAFVKEEIEVELPKISFEHFPTEIEKHVWEPLKVFVKESFADLLK